MLKTSCSYMFPVVHMHILLYIRMLQFNQPPDLFSCILSSHLHNWHYFSFVLRVPVCYHHPPPTPPSSTFPSASYLRGGSHLSSPPPLSGLVDPGRRHPRCHTVTPLNPPLSPGLPAAPAPFLRSLAMELPEPRQPKSKLEPWTLNLTLLAVSPEALVLPSSTVFDGEPWIRCQPPCDALARHRGRSAVTDTVGPVGVLSFCRWSDT
jgi:hypothetical protein